MCPESLALGPGNKITDVKNCHNYNSWFLHMFDDSIDALFMCNHFVITSSSSAQVSVMQGAGKL